MFGASNKKRIAQLEDRFSLPRIDKYDLEQVSRYVRNAKDLNEFDQRVLSDLDLDDIFQYIDRTFSRVGQQTLYARLAAPRDYLQLTEEDELKTSRLQSDPQLRQKLMQALVILDSKDSLNLPALFQENLVQLPDWYRWAPYLSFTTILSLVLTPFNPWLIFVWLPLMAVNFVLHYRNKRLLYSLIIAVPQLVRLYKVASRLNKSKEFGSKTEVIKSALKDIKSIKRRLRWFSLEMVSQNEYAVAFHLLVEIVKMLLLLEPLLLRSALVKLKDRGESVHEVFKFVGHWDVLLSIASLRSHTENWCQPTFSPNLELKGAEVYHPLIEGAVANTFQTSGKSFVITGSNMSGKTTFIRTIGINLICGYAINTVFAKKFTTSKFQIHSAIRINDDLLNNKSYYMEEVQRIRDMLTSSLKDEFNLFLLDELYKGTNTRERVAAGKAVLDRLTTKKSLVFVSTHDLELALMLQPQYECFYFTENISEDTVVFDYKLKEGVLNETNALRLLEVNGYPKDLVNEARKTADSMKKPMNNT